MIAIICHTLEQRFPEYKVYGEQVLQMEVPAFRVQNLETVQVKGIGNLYKRQSNFVIRCFLKENVITVYEELTSVANKLYEVLEVMEMNGKKLRGKDMKYHIEDNVLQFFMTCAEHLKRDTQEPLMAELTEELRKKG